MSYRFSPTRFVPTLLLLTVGMFLIVTALRLLLNVALPLPAVAVIPIVLVAGLEGRICGRTSSHAPRETLMRQTAISMALYSAGTFLVLALVGVIAAGRVGALSGLQVWLSLLAPVAILGGTQLIVGYFVFRAESRRAFKARL